MSREGASLRTLQRRSTTGTNDAQDQVADEIPVALHYNGASFAVLMATPCDLADLPFAGLRFFRSSGLQPGSGMKESQASSGRVAEWLCSGLQIRVRRFNSDLGLHHSMVLKPRFGGVFLWALPCTAATRRRTGGHAASTSM